MYDISTQIVNKLNGALSSAFVSVAEENAGSDDIENANISDSGIVEKMPTISTDNNKSSSSSKNDNSETTKLQKSVSSSTISESRNDKSKDVQRFSINSGYSIKNQK